MATEISEVHEHGAGRYKFSFVDSDGRKVNRTGRSRRQLEGERLRLFDAGSSPASAPAPIEAVKGTAAWWRELAESAALAAHAALVAGDPIGASLARKTAASLGDLSRSGSLAQQVAELEAALADSTAYIERTLASMGYRSDAYEQAAQGFNLILRAKNLLTGGIRMLTIEAGDVESVPDLTGPACHRAPWKTLGGPRGHRYDEHGAFLFVSGSAAPTATERPGASEQASPAAP